MIFKSGQLVAFKRDLIFTLFPEAIHTKHVATYTIFWDNGVSCDEDFTADDFFLVAALGSEKIDYLDYCYKYIYLLSARKGTLFCIIENEKSPYFLDEPPLDYCNALHGCSLKWSTSLLPII